MGWGQQKGEKGGKGKKSSPTKAERESVSGPRQEGTIVEWKGSFGWIQPSKEIKHANAHKHGGKVFLSAEDVSDELDGVGAVVNFDLYADSSGMGATDCKNGPAPVQKPTAPATKGAAKAAGKGAGKDKGKDSAKAGKKRDAPEREDISGPRQTGTILDWKGSFGWIQPSKPIEHELAQRRGGKVFLSVEDVTTELEGVGAVVNFTLYADTSGLGAADCKAGPAPAGKASPPTKGAAKGAAKGAGKAAGNGKATWQAPEPAEKKQNTGKGKGKGKDERTILHEEPLIGTITEWKGTSGWVKPQDTIDHPLMQKQRGDLVLLQTDVEAEIEGVGAVIQFILVQEGTRLLAAHVKPAE